MENFFFVLIEFELLTDLGYHQLRSIRRHKPAAISRRFQPEFDRHTSPVVGCFLSELLYISCFGDENSCNDKTFGSVIVIFSIGLYQF